MIFVSIISSLCWSSQHHSNREMGTARYWQNCTQDSCSNNDKIKLEGVFQKSQYAAHRTAVRMKEVNLELTMTPKSVMKLTSSEIKIKLIFSKIKFEVDFQQTGSLSLLVVLVDCSDTIHGRLVVNCWPAQPSLWSWWWGWPSWYLSKKIRIRMAWVSHSLRCCRNVGAICEFVNSSPV